MITPAHRARLGNGTMLATSPRIDWARLLRRTFAIEALVCPRCRHPARVLAVIEDEHEARRLASALGEGSRPAIQTYPESTQKDDRLHELTHADDDEDFERPPDSAQSELADLHDLDHDD